jgi:manganese oxidase
MSMDKTSRRAFLKNTSLAAATVAALAACDTKSVPAVAQQGTATKGPPTGGTMGPHDTGTGAPLGPTVASEQMDAMHEKGVKAFPAKTAIWGNQRLEPTMDGNTKVFNLTSKVVQWETEPGHFVTGWGYNGVVPGPQIRVREGDRVRIVLKNELPESTAIHFHGLQVPNNQDGVPFITQPPIKPGATYTYEFTVPNAGSHMYHSHHNSTKQVGLGLLGAFIVEPRRKTQWDNVDVDYVMVLYDGAHGYTFNGKSFPATEPIVSKRGQRVRVRFMNEGMMIHPMHLHGMPMTVIAKDGYLLPMPWKCDTLNIAPGDRWDVVIDCQNPGTWAFHCHILPHAESEMGMFGMVTALVIA